jgi:hypothetical protein
MRLTIAALGALALLSTAPAAAAATVSGTFFPPDSNPTELANLGLEAGGVYLVSFDLSRPGTGDLLIDFQQVYNVYDRATNDYQYGDELLFNQTFDFTPPTTHFQTLFKLPRNYVLYSPFDYEVGFWFGDISLNAGFDGGQPVNFRLSAERLATVPEPATWLSLLLGFGLLGSALRRRRGPRAAIA